MEVVVGFDHIQKPGGNVKRSGGNGKGVDGLRLEHKESVANALFSLVDGEGSTSKPKPETKTPEKTGNSEKPWKEAVKARKKLIKTAKKSKKTSKK